MRILDRPPQPIDLVLTDVIMPKMGGRELVEILEHNHPTIKALFMSSYTEQYRVLKPNAVFLQKPFTVTDLARKVRELLDTPVKPA